MDRQGGVRVHVSRNFISLLILGDNFPGMQFGSRLLHDRSPLFLPRHDEIAL